MPRTSRPASALHIRLKPQPRRKGRYASVASPNAVHLSPRGGTVQWNWARRPPPTLRFSVAIFFAVLLVRAWLASRQISFQLYYSARHITRTHTHTNTRKDHTDHQKVHQPPRITTAADHPGHHRLPQRGARGRRSVVSPLASRPPRPLDAGFTAPGSPPPPANARSRSARRTAPAAGGGAVPRHDLRRGRLLRYSSAATMRSLRGWGEVASLG